MVTTKRKVRTLFLSLLLFTLLNEQTAIAVPSECQDIWRIDLHAVAYLNADEQNFLKLKYYRWENNQWQVAEAKTFFDTQQAEMPLIVFAPGYTSTTSQTTQTGLALVKHFDPDKPCRVVFWNWYSEKGQGTLRCDVRNKLSIIGRTADYLALFLQKMQPQSKVCLFGFSFGSRIVCEATESLRKSGQRPDGLRLNLVVSGAATDAHWFAKGHKHGDVPEIVEKILVTYNPEDWVLRFYHLMYGLRHKSKALGRTGLPMQRIDSAYRDRFENIVVNRYIGDEHQTLYHVQTPVFRSRIDGYFFFE